MSSDVNPLVWVGVIFAALCLLGIEYARQRKNPRTSLDRARERPFRQGLLYPQMASAALFGVLLTVIAFIGLIKGMPVVLVLGLLGAIGAGGAARYIYITAQRSD